MHAPDLADAAWRTSSLSSPHQDNCVEVAPLTEAVAVRDSTDPAGPAFAFARPEWGAFIASARQGDFAS